MGLVPIRVLVAGLPRLLTEMVSAALDQPPRFEFAAGLAESVRPGSYELDRAIRDRRPDALVVGLGAGECHAVGVTQLQHPELAVVAIAPNGEDAWSVDVRPHFETLRSVSPSGIREAISTTLDAHASAEPPCPTIEHRPD